MTLRELDKEIDKIYHVLRVSTYRPDTETLSRRLLALSTLRISMVVKEPHDN